ncbi:MerR family transcriptional regulator [Ammoniphilus sp. CFH 90114]|uniref:MerR family transcriptional regulator n=1 Tax=Ammoniphilus sp. CFH 90114 TaxID=2493665 RepID=UPI00100FDB88|nr:MerR family transcriptional regulator [Ammoniphilus sp. CFH 90114]RXT02825.1 MerR family transcriptional regulator [Ammoniphilus sp. CFH 90114]
MYSIGEISKLTGITAYTLRYYEKIGVLPEPRRQDGKRCYDDQDLQYVRFIHGLKETGMSLGKIATFTEDGCLLISNNSEFEIHQILQKRIDMLDQHIHLLDQQMKQLEMVKEIAQRKSALYSTMLKEGALNNDGL